MERIYAPNGDGVLSFDLEDTLAVAKCVVRTAQLASSAAFVPSTGQLVVGTGSREATTETRLPTLTVLLTLSTQSF